MTDHTKAIKDALEAMVQALDDWVLTYASELCDNEKAEEARLRILQQGGTIAYVTDTRVAGNKAIRSLLSRLEEAERDAQRYRWLRDNLDSDWAICEWSSSDLDGIGYYRDARAAQVVDAAIDAAIKEQSK